MEAGKRTKETTEGSVPIKKGGNKIGGNFISTANPQFIKSRIQIYEEIMKDQKKFFEQASRREIKITLKDGKEIIGKCFETTPLEIAKKISKKLAENAVVAKVIFKNREKTLETDVINTGPENENNDEEKFELYDLTRPLEGDCELHILNFEDPLGKMVFWHSSAHIFGEALEMNYGCHLCIGPPLNNGFYYDCYMGENKITPQSYEGIEKTAKKCVSENQQFERIVLSKAQALKMFEDNPFKVQLIQNKIPENGKTTAYRCGNLIDLCTGPHVVHTGKIKALKVTKNSSAYWLGDNENDDLQRVYGISFPSDKQLKEYLKIQEELAKRDHRNIGRQQDLFHFNIQSPGSPFFFPHGAIIYHKLQNFLRQQYLFFGYKEVISPNIYNSHLWMISGHWEKFKDDLFVIKEQHDNVEVNYGVKPMNCPGHCLMFDMHLRSYRELPLRMADFGVLHRNEIHGALSGLTRVRRFQQDDAHIFCTLDQIMDEVMTLLNFVDYVYGLFGFEFKLGLSTRPENFLGDIKLWDKAEESLSTALNKFGKKWTINPKDGAFYGPKIDIKLFDAFQREHQCGTIQLDFVLPERFNLQYKASETEEEVKKEIELEKELEKKKAEELKKKEDLEKKEGKENQINDKENLEDHKKHKEHPNHPNHPPSHHYHQFKEIGGHLKPGFQRPVIIHRAIIGSFERIFAILCEHYGGKWPFWISPRQVIICPISEKFENYAERINSRLRLEGYQCEIDKSNSSMNKKIRNAQLAQFNYIAVVGMEEEESGTVDLRDRDKSDRLGKFTINKLLKFFSELHPTQSSTEKNLRKFAFFSSNEEFEILNKELSLKVFLEKDGYCCGERDKEMYEKLKGKNIDSDLFPNLFRWQNFMKKQSE